MDISEHSNIILPVCVEIFKRLEGKIDVLLEQTNKLNDKFQEVAELRAMVHSHEEKFAQLDVHRRWAIGMQVSTIVIIAVQIGSFLFLWGSLNKQVAVNTDRIASIEEIHPRVAK